VKSNKEDANAKLMMLASSRSIVLWSTSDQTSTTISKKKVPKRQKHERIDEKMLE
jgi:hypothetical protein